MNNDEVEVKTCWVICGCGRRHLLKLGVQGPYFICRYTGNGMPYRLLREGMDVDIDD